MQKKRLKIVFLTFRGILKPFFLYAKKKECFQLFLLVAYGGWKKYAIQNVCLSFIPRALDNPL